MENRLEEVMRFQSGKSGNIQERPLKQWELRVSEVKKTVGGRGQSGTRPANAKVGHAHPPVKVW